MNIMANEKGITFKEIGAGYNYPVAGHMIGLDMESKKKKKKLLSIVGH